mmetsp:Transcript_82237/g.160497  ORF Transcript_82237/g.160497 Transcript_82237/m.160497 type:complete len:204 (-) Transcript_82237:160-771(-)
MLLAASAQHQQQEILLRTQQPFFYSLQSATLRWGGVHPRTHRAARHHFPTLTFHQRHRLLSTSYLRKISNGFTETRKHPFPRPVSFRPSTLMLTWRGAQPRVPRAARLFVSASGSPTLRRHPPGSHSTSCFRFLFPFLRPETPRVFSSSSSSSSITSYLIVPSHVHHDTMIPFPHMSLPRDTRHCCTRSQRDSASCATCILLH